LCARILPGSAELAAGGQSPALRVGLVGRRRVVGVVVGASVRGEGRSPSSWLGLAGCVRDCGGSAVFGDPRREGVRFYADRRIYRGRASAYHRVLSALANVGLGAEAADSFVSAPVFRALGVETIV